MRAQTPSAVTQQSGLPERVAPPLTPLVPAGESALPNSDGATATRSDTDVVVSFDVMMLRTRRPAKFEQIVRATLPAVYGRSASDALRKIPDVATARVVPRYTPFLSLTTKQRPVRRVVRVRTTQRLPRPLTGLPTPSSLPSPTRVGLWPS